MLLLGHIGITLGAAGFLSGVLTATYPKSVKNNDNLELTTRQKWLDRIRAFLRTTYRWPTSFSSKVEFRILLLGAILPDLIDKPLGFLWLDNGRVFCHTLLFFTIITILGLYLHKAFNKMTLHVIAFGCGIHLLLDEMWLESRTFWWPLFGVSFEKLDSGSIGTWFELIIEGLISNPVVYLGEIFGGLIIVTFIAKVFSERRQPKVF
jgi:hypothetical protein